MPGRRFIRSGYRAPFKTKPQKRRAVRAGMKKELAKKQGALHGMRVTRSRAATF